jgi:hypothetical protein
LGFNEIAIGTEGFAAGALVFTGERGHHDDFNIFRFGGAAEDVQHVKATNFWHHDVADD